MSNKYKLNMQMFSEGPEPMNPAYHYIYWYLDETIVKEEHIGYDFDYINACEINTDNTKEVGLSFNILGGETYSTSYEYDVELESVEAEIKYDSDNYNNIYVYAISKAKRTTAKGTWLLNETLSYSSSNTVYSVEGNFTTYLGGLYTEFEYDSIVLKTYINIISCVIAHEYGGDYGVANNYYMEDDIVINNAETGDTDYVSLTSENGINMRTFTITGGDDVENADLISWLEENATFVAEYEEEVTYTISINTSNCSYTPTTTEIKSTETLTFTFTANSGYEMSDISATNCTYSVSDNSITISNPTDNVVITANAYVENLEGVWLINSSLTKPSGEYIYPADIYTTFKNPGEYDGFQWYRLETNTTTPYLELYTDDYDGGGEYNFAKFYVSNQIATGSSNFTWRYYSVTETSRTIGLKAYNDFKSITSENATKYANFVSWFKQNATKLRDLVDYIPTYNLTNCRTYIKKDYPICNIPLDTDIYFYANDGYEFPEDEDLFNQYVYVEDTSSGYTITRNSSSNVTITLNGMELNGDPTINVEAVKSHVAITPQTITISNGVPGDTYSATFTSLPKGQITADVQNSASKCLQEANVTVLVQGTNVYTGLFKNMSNSTLYIEEGYSAEIYINFPTDISQSWQGTTYTTTSNLYDLYFIQDDGVQDGMVNFDISLGSISLEVTEITTPIAQLPVKFSTSFNIKNTGTIPIDIGLETIYSENMGLEETFIITNESGEDVSQLGDGNTLNLVQNLLPDTSEIVLITHKSQIVKSSMLNKEASVSFQIHAAQYKNNANKELIGFTKETTNTFNFVTPTFTTYRPIYKKNSEGLWETQEAYQMRKDDLGGFIKVSEKGVTYENVYNVTYLYPVDDVELIEGESTIKLGEKNAISVMFGIKDFTNNDYYFPTDMTDYLTITNAQLVGNASSISDNENVVLQVYKSETDSPGDVTIQVACVSKSIYNITTNLTGCTASSSNVTTITQFGTATLTFIPNDNASFDLTTLENNISISGTSYTLSNSENNLVVTLTNPTNNVTINVSTPNIYEEITIPEVTFSLEGSDPVTITGTLSTYVSITGGTGTYSVSSSSDVVKPSISTISSGTLLILTFTSKAALQDTTITVTSGRQTSSFVFKPTITNVSYTTWYADSSFTDATYGDGDILFVNTSFRDKTTNLNKIAFATSSGGAPIMLSNDDVTNHFKLYSLHTTSYSPTTSAVAGYAYEFNNSVESYYDGALEENRTLLIRDGDTTNETLINWLLRNTVLVDTNKISFSASGDSLYYGLYADKNTTWENWVSSSYNTEGFTISDGKIYVDDTHYLEGVESSYIIAAGYEYTIAQSSSTLTDLTGTTWLLNEYFESNSSNEYYQLKGEVYYPYDIYGNEIVETNVFYGFRLYYGIVLIFSSTADTGTLSNTYYVDSDDEDTIYGDYISTYFNPDSGTKKVKKIDNETSDGIKLRTISITGGNDVENADLISWFQTNATLISGGG